MKKFLFIFLLSPLLIFSGCFGSGPLEYHNTLVGLENELAKVAVDIEPALTSSLTTVMKDGFDKSQYEISISPLLSSLDKITLKTEELGGYDGDDTVQKQLLMSINAIRYLLESDIPTVFTALTEKPEEAETLMKDFIEKVGAMEKYDNDLKAKLDAFDKKNGVVVK